MLKISVFTNGRILQFFNCHKLLKFPARHQLSESSVKPFDSIEIPSVECLKKISRTSSTFFTGACTWIPESLFLIFQHELFADALMLAEPCRETNMARSQPPTWLIFWNNSKRLWLMCLIKKLKTSKSWLKLWFVANFFPPIENREF